jgi:mono/diheme cytochrome c family protein
MLLRSFLTSVVTISSLATFAIASAPITPAKQAEIVAAGKKIYETNCLVCHGAKGKGDGAAAAALNPKPRNFSDAAYMKKRPIETLRKVITEGGQSVGLSPVMVAWKAILKPAQIESVLQYVLTFSNTGTSAK